MIWTLRAFGCVLGLGFMVGCSIAPSETPAETIAGTVVPIFADSPVYGSHLQTEFPWYGTLEQTDDGTRYSLSYGEKTQLIYTDRAIPALAPLVGERVVIRGKLVGTDDYAPITPDSELWPATIAAFEPLLLECYKDETVTPEQKLSRGLKRRLAAEPGETRARIIIGFCDNLEITPYFNVDELTELRAPLYATVERELEPYGVKVQETFWLTQGMVAEMPLNRVFRVAERPDARSLEDAEETAPPP